MEERTVLIEKIFVLDTNVIIHNPYAVSDGDFQEHQVVIPMVVVEELDDLKRNSDVSYSIREAHRVMEDLIGKQPLSGPIDLSGGGKLMFYPRLSRKQFGNMERNPDNEIIQTAFLLRKRNSEKHVIVISDDTSVLIKSRILGLESQRYNPNYVQRSGVLRGIDTINLNEDQCQDFFQEGTCILSERKSPNRIYAIRCDGHTRSDGRQKGMQEGFLDKEGLTLQLVDMKMKRCKRVCIKPQDTKQAVAWDVLTNEEIELVALIGEAGTGKTLLSVAAGIEQVLEGRYEELMIARPVVAVGDKERLGFLPGTREEKLSPWLEPIWDNIFYIMQSGCKIENFRGKTLSSKRREDFMAAFKEAFPINVLSIEHLRGRTLRDAYVIIDECQNTDKTEIKTILSRAGKDTKIVLAGDITQVDIHPYGGRAANGLSLTAAAFADVPSASIIQLSKIFRSKLAELAVQLL